MAPTNRSSTEDAPKHPNKPRTMVVVLCCTAIILCLAVTGLLIMVTVTIQELTDFGPLSSVQKTLYTMFSTFVATLITGIVSGQLVTASLCKLDDDLIPTVTSNRSESPSLRSMSSTWNAILSLSLPNLLRLRNWLIAFTVLVTSLITTSITSGFTPTTATRVVNYSSDIPTGEPTTYSRPWDPDQMPDTPAAYNSTAWFMSNGSIFYSWVGRGGSPAHEAMALSHGINIFDPDLYAYADDGVAVHSSAIGTPYSVYGERQGEDNVLSQLLARYDRNVPNITACVPVMVRNPFKCYKGALMDWIENDTIMRLYSEDGSCMIRKKVANAEQVEMLKGFCAHDEIGQGTLLLGSDFNYHAWVAVAVGDPDIPPYEVPSRFTYSVQCDVDARNVWEYRNVVLSLSNSERTNHAFSKVLTSNVSCVPNHDSTITDTLLAITATANQFLLRENTGNSGWFETINALTSKTGGYGRAAQDSLRSPPWAFADSSNALEDILGLTAALVSSRIYKNSTMIPTSGTADVRFTRIGPGKYFGLVYALPPLISSLILTSLLYRMKKHSQGYESSSLQDLIDLGKDSVSLSDRQHAVR